MKNHLNAYGGKGFDHLQVKFLPLLKKMGIREESFPDDLCESC